MYNGLLVVSRSELVMVLLLFFFFNEFRLKIKRKQNNRIKRIRRNASDSYAFSAVLHALFIRFIKRIFRRFRKRESEREREKKERKKKTDIFIGRTIHCLCCYNIIFDELTKYDFNRRFCSPRGRIK